MLWRAPAEGLDLTDIDWLIAGGESEAHHRRVRPDSVRDLRDRCAAEGVAFFFKQWGGRTPKAGGRQLDGCTCYEMPTRTDPRALTA
jgi:protein gp37